MLKRRSIPLLFVPVCALVAAADLATEGNLWWDHVRFLADDALAGRDTGSEGFQKAVEYVSHKFQGLGLKPAGTSGYLQPVSFESRRLIATESKVTLVREGKEEPLAIGRDVTLNLRGEPATSVSAAMVFVGYGMTIPEANYDDAAGLDLRGKIAVYVNAQGPVEAQPNVKSHYSSAAQRWAALRKAGAIGVGVIAVPRNQEVNGRGAQPSGDTGAAGRGPATQMVLAEEAMREGAGQKIAFNITRNGAAKFFEGSGHTFEEIDKLAKDNQPLPKFALLGTLRATLVVERGKVQAPNVAGLLEGSDARLKKEYVIMSAHLDHIGVGRPVNGDSINNGAMDDASGIASILEIARLMKENGARPKRSILFLAVTAEEKGELGSAYFAAHPTVPFRQIVADINLDMFLPLYPLKVIEVQGLAESTLGDQVQAAAEQRGVAVQTDREPAENRFIRSDQYSFIKRGIPSLAFKFGYEYGSPEEKIRKDWVRERYHKPSDDLSQPIDKEAAAKFDRVIMGLLERVADDPARPAWKSDSFFRRFAR